MIIVTGGAGFIGSAIVAELNRRGQDDILIVDILGTDEKWKNLRKLKYTDYIEADEFYESIKSGKTGWQAEAVIHMGACSSTTEPDCSYLLKNNFECSKLAAGWAMEKNARFIYASSAATYGDGEKGFVDDEEKLNTLKPLNMYGYSKQMFDLWAKRKGYLSSIVGLKYFNVFGPNEYHKAGMRSFVNKAFYQINELNRVGLFKSYRDDYEDGQQLRDFIYIKDAVDMTLFFMEKPDLSGIYNVGTGSARSWNDLAAATFKAMDKRPVINYVPMPDDLINKYQYFTQADITRIRNAGYDKTITSLEDSVKDYIRNYLMKDEYL